ncbi:hypothetical protein PUN28_009289 [Cardiocondyla obscurior]|uniref:Kinetochore protein SPC25 n=1 Tax=Cardiocondyla obscurior TaxID=286306 RepID=A0AAW2FWW3_9HYME
MDIEEFKCNLFDVFQKDDYTILNKLISSCQEFRLSVDAKIKQRHLYEKECNEKKSLNVNKMSELQKKIGTIKFDIDKVILEQKLIDKKKSTAIRTQDSLKEELKKGKDQREALSLQMVDLQIEKEERRGKQLLQWDAIKRALRVYKVNLDIHIDLEQTNDCQYIKFSFFKTSQMTKDKYFIQLSCNNNHWKIHQIEPKLKKEHLKEASAYQDSPEHTTVTDITLFLYQIRRIFLKYYNVRQNEGKAVT